MLPFNLFALSYNVVLTGTQYVSNGIEGTNDYGITIYDSGNNSSLRYVYSWAVANNNVNNNIYSTYNQIASENPFNVWMGYETDNPSSTLSSNARKILSYTYYTRYMTTEDKNVYLESTNLPVKNSDYSVNYGYFLGKLFDKSSEFNLTTLTSNNPVSSWISGSNPYSIVSTGNCYMIAKRGYSGTTMNVYFFSDQQFSITASRTGSSNITPTITSFNCDGTDWYWGKISNWTWNPTNYTYSWDTIQCDFNDTNFVGYMVSTLNGSVNPPVINHGILKDLGYSTRFTNTQQDSTTAMRNNVDVITWDGYQDTLGNQINTLDYWVDIQAYRTEYYANTLSDLLNLTINSRTMVGNPVDLITISPNVGKFEITWGDVATAFLGSNPVRDFFHNISPHIVENIYYTDGGADVI